MVRKNYLKRDEISSEVKVDFDNQVIENGQLKIEVYCPVCERTRMVGVAIIRYRKNVFTGICKSCARPGHKHVRYLKPEEIRPEVLEHIDFDSQSLERLFDKKKQKSYNALFISVTCKECKVVRRVQVSSIRGHSDIFTSLCWGCYNRGKYNPNWGGGKSTRWGGYIAVKVYDTHPNFEILEPMIRKDNTLLEHRLVMAQKIGRALERYEEVHHINGDKLDNRPENLELVDRKSHYLITVADTEVKRLRAENQALENKIKELEEALQQISGYD